MGNMVRRAVCPVCGMEYTGCPAVSRTDGQTLVCPDCGTREALTAMGLERAEQEKILGIIHRFTGQEQK